MNQGERERVGVEKFLVYFPFYEKGFNWSLSQLKRSSCRKSENHYLNVETKSFLDRVAETL